MNDSDNFLTRWSRRKRGAPADSTAGDKPIPPHASERKDPERTAEAGDPLVDLTNLPSIDSITANTDISGFLAPGVPEGLKAAALRRAWAADPTIRNFVGLADYDWDFNTPGAIPGFGPLKMDDDLRREIARITGDLVSEPEPAKPGVQDDSEPSEPSLQVAVATEEKEPRTGLPGGDGVPGGNEVAGQEITAAQQDILQTKDAEPLVRRSHGRALPK